jgi:hypothetical protein
MSWMIEQEHQKWNDQKLKVLEQKHGKQNDRDTLKYSIKNMTTKSSNAKARPTKTWQLKAWTWKHDHEEHDDQ